MYQVSVYRTIGPLVASCDLEFGLNSKLNDLTKEYEYSNSRLRFAQPFLTMFCMFFVYTRLRFQVSAYRTMVLWLQFKK